MYDWYNTGSPPNHDDKPGGGSDGRGCGGDDPGGGRRRVLAHQISRSLYWPRSFLQIDTHDIEKINKLIVRDQLMGISLLYCENSLESDSLSFYAVK